MVSGPLYYVSPELMICLSVLWNVGHLENDGFLKLLVI
jgi:hypothetical protein